MELAIRQPHLAIRAWPNMFEHGEAENREIELLLFFGYKGEIIAEEDVVNTMEKEEIVGNDDVPALVRRLNSAMADAHS